MPRVDLPTGASIYYEEFGEGFPLLLFAPGGMDSRLEMWYQAPWNPIEALSPYFRVIAMDQRNAHRSFAPLAVTDWGDLAADQAALLNALGIERTHIMGGCIGSSFCLRFMHDNPGRTTAAILQNPIGLRGGNFDGFKGMFEIAARTAEEGGMQAVVDAALANDRFQQNHAGGLWAARIAADEAFREEMLKMDATEYARIQRGTSDAFFGRSDFVFSVTREWVETLDVPLLVLAGHDDFHPTETAREIAELAPKATYVEEWAPPEVRERTIETAREFLLANTPK
ncbi:MAG: alpha/beta hydrolase [Dehalococcoidia bacterium]|nr:alpha/beta hydrolase [Dehalococcoidia bacterium]